MFLTLLALSVSAIIGVTFGIPLVILAFLGEVFKSSGIDDIVKEPIGEIRNRRGHF